MLFVENDCFVIRKIRGSCVRRGASSSHDLSKEVLLAYGDNSPEGYPPVNTRGLIYKNDHPPGSQFMINSHQYIWLCGGTFVCATQ